MIWPPVPRGLSVAEAADYLGVSKWTVFDYLAAGYIRALDLPALRPRSGDRPKRRLRRIVIDRRELDRFLDALAGHTLGTLS